MSYNWMLIRGGNANPSSLKFTAMMNKQNIAENEIFKPESDQPRIISKETEDLCLVQDPFSFRQLKHINNWHYYGGFEPDGEHLTYWCRFNHIASKIRDMSFSGNYTVPVGSPQLCGGPSDGVKGGTIVTRINNFATSDYFYTPDNPRIGVTGLTTGFSQYIEFMVDRLHTGTELIPVTTTIQGINRGIKPPGFKVPGFKLSIPPNTTTDIIEVGEEQTINMKIDDADAQYGRILRVGTDGSLKWFVSRAGTVRNFISAPNKIRTGLWYAVALTYDMSSNAMQMRINNEPQTDSANETPTFPTNHSTDMFHGVGPGLQGEFLIGRFKDSRFYKEMIFSSDQMDNIWNNKRSISPIQYGHLSVAGVAKFNNHVISAAYSPVGYDNTAFETS